MNVTRGRHLTFLMSLLMLCIACELSKRMLCRRTRQHLFAPTPLFFSSTLHGMPPLHPACCTPQPHYHHNPLDGMSMRLSQTHHSRPIIPDHHSRPRISGLCLPQQCWAAVARIQGLRCLFASSCQALSRLSRLRCYCRQLGSSSPGSRCGWARTPCTPEHAGLHSAQCCMQGGPAAAGEPPASGTRTCSPRIPAGHRRPPIAVLQPWRPPWPAGVWLGPAGERDLALHKWRAGLMESGCCSVDSATLAEGENVPAAPLCSGGVQHGPAAGAMRGFGLHRSRRCPVLPVAHCRRSHRKPAARCQPRLSSTSLECQRPGGPCDRGSGTAA